MSTVDPSAPTTSTAPAPTESTTVDQASPTTDPATTTSETPKKSKKKPK
jgi:hypothetical protein